MHEGHPRSGSLKPTAPSRTALGRRLREIRQRIEASGQPLLDWDGIDRELWERRGGIGNYQPTGPVTAFNSQ